MQLQQINEAIAGLCIDVEETIISRIWNQMTEREVIHELLLCILGSGVRYEMAVSYSTAISSSKYLIRKNISDQGALTRNISLILNNPVSNYWGGKPYNRYRYPNIRASYISSSYCNIMNKYGSFRRLLRKGYSASDLRRKIVHDCSGIGPKQASHFLKNIGYTDKLAVLDRHIVKYMEIAKDISVSTYQLGKLEKYEVVESQYINAVKKFEYPVAIVDQAMWFVMRALGTEARV